MVTDQHQSFPDFTNPPVDETVLSVQFAPIAGFGAPHFGLYWATIRREFERFQMQPPIASVTEQFGPSPRVAPRMGIQFVTEPELRCWFLDQSGGRLLQVQRDRFIHNWRRITGNELYPRYPSIRTTLHKEWLGFCAFLDREKLGQPQVNQCEVTYVNQIEIGNGWNGYEELSRVVASWSGARSGSFLPHPDRVNMETHYLLPNNLGRLHIAIEPVIRGRDAREVLQLTLTARGAPKSSTIDDIFAWLDLGREWVVKGFGDFTTPEMHKIWGRKS